MIRLVVVENPKRWPLDLHGAEVVNARTYLTDPRYSSLRRAAVFNLCRDYSYQSLGYYVSLLATARGHRPLPSVATLQDLGVGPAVRVLADHLDERMQRDLGPLRSDRFELSVYFGRNTSKRYDGLSRILFNHFPAPLLRAKFARDERWRLTSLRAIAAQDVPESHHPFVAAQAERYFAGRGSAGSRRKRYRYDLAILWREDDPEPPSNERAIRRFVRAARSLDIDAEIIDEEEYGRLAEFDALLIRQTTSPNDHTYRFSRKAEAEGLVVIDDPESIIRCTNKVYQAELLARNGVPMPRTLVTHPGNAERVAQEIGFPCVLKRPDSSFSLGVVKVESADRLEQSLRETFETYPLVIAQAWTPSDFDWRIGVLDRRPLFACRYHMVRGHWQIAQGGRGSPRRYGRVEAVALEEAPSRVVETAVRAGSLIGGGLYGVDVKEIEGAPVVIEINDNPNIDAGGEDGHLGDELYRTIMRYYRDRLNGRATL